jgi:hypothetical protein
MKTRLNIFVILVLIAFLTSCHKKPTLTEFKFIDRDLDLKCNVKNYDLIKEAVISFEYDITDFYDLKGNKNLAIAYSRTVQFGLSYTTDYKKIVSPHTLEIFKILRLDNDLWRDNGRYKTLNYDHELLKCIASNLSDKELQTTLNALLSTKSMSPELFGEPLRRKSPRAVHDKYLATYIALDIFYSGLFNVDLSLFDYNKNDKETETNPN